MAILHARFGRVIYGTPNRESGGLGTRFKMHTEPALNHHFEVFAGLLRDGCAALWGDADTKTLTT